MAIVQFEGSVEVVARKAESARAAVLDVASAFPEQAEAFQVVDRLSGRFDVVVITAGIQPAVTMRRSQMLRINLEIAVDSVEDVEVSDSTIFVIVGSPVDELTEEFLKLQKGLGPHQVLGFGGELDRCRLIYSLLSRQITPEDTTTVVGEHGPRAIPVYDGETDFDAVAYDVQSVLPQMQSATGKARNLASGVHLARLLQALSGMKTVHCISVVGEEGPSLTWPCLIDKGGVVSKLRPRLGPRAEEALAVLMRRRAERVI
jgi:hypothetical protein